MDLLLSAAAIQEAAANDQSQPPTDIPVDPNFVYRQDIYEIFPCTTKDAAVAIFKSDVFYHSHMDAQGRWRSVPALALAYRVRTELSPEHTWPQAVEPGREGRTTGTGPGRDEHGCLRVGARDAFGAQPFLTVLSDAHSGKDAARLWWAAPDVPVDFMEPALAGTQFEFLPGVKGTIFARPELVMTVRGVRYTWVQPDDFSYDLLNQTRTKAIAVIQCLSDRLVVRLTMEAVGLDLAVPCIAAAIRFKGTHPNDSVHRD